MTKEDYILISKKIDQELTSDEARLFEKKLTQDPTFKEEYIAYQATVTVFQTHHPTLKQEAKKLYEEVKAEQQRKRWFPRAAVISLLVGAIVLLYQYYPSSKTLYKQYYHIYSAGVVGRGDQTVTKQSLMYYQEGKYEMAIPLLKRLLLQDTIATERWHLLLGNAYLQVDSTQLAIKQFRQTANSKEIAYQQYGNWYLTMAYLKQGNTKEVQELAQQIALDSGMYSQEATQLLKDLN